MNLKAYQAICFLFGWTGYASTYFLRKPLGIIKNDLHTQLGISLYVLGLLDVAMLLPYSIVQIMFSSIGDKISPRLVSSTSLILAGLATITFGVWNSVPMFFMLLAVSGAFQGLCWPNMSKIIASWFADDVRNTVFGVFGTCAFAGGIFGSLIAVAIQAESGWRYVYFMPSFAVIALGAACFFFLREPAEVGILVPGKELSTSSLSPKVRASLSFAKLWTIPAVKELAFAVFTLKLVRYCIYMWLPMYLLNQLHYTTARSGIFSTVFEIGGVLGSTSIGFIIDRYFPGRALEVNTCSVLVSALALIAFIATSTWGPLANSVCMFAAGACNCASDGMLVGSVASELGEMRNMNAAAAVVGFINGFGSLGAVVEGPIVGILKEQTGWLGIFYAMIVTCLLGAAAIARARVLYRRCANDVGHLGLCM